MEGDAPNWMESSPVRDLLIKNNRFLDCGISIKANIKERKPEAPVHENIRIVGNAFEGKRTSIHAKSVQGLEVSGNRSKPGQLKISVEASCTQVKIENNTVEQ